MNLDSSHRGNVITVPVRNINVTTRLTFDAVVVAVHILARTTGKQPKGRTAGSNGGTEGSPENGIEVLHDRMQHAAD